MRTQRSWGRARVFIRTARSLGFVRPGPSGGQERRLIWDDAFIHCIKATVVLCKPHTNTQSIPIREHRRLQAPRTADSGGVWPRPSPLERTRYLSQLVPVPRHRQISSLPSLCEMNEAYKGIAEIRPPTNRTEGEEKLTPDWQRRPSHHQQRVDHVDSSTLPDPRPTKFH